MSRQDLPTPNAANFAQRSRETMMTYLGQQGDPLDRGITVRDLVGSNLITLKPGHKVGSGTLALQTGTAITNVTAAVDLTPPPTPTGFSLSAAISHVFVEHSTPVYTQGHGHLRTRVYGVQVASGAPLPTFGNAVEIGQFSGVIWALSSNPATTWRLWIKWETKDGVLSVVPAGGTNGLEAITGQNVTQLLTALTGQIADSQLQTALSTRINLIDANVTVAGSVNNRIQTEAMTRATADTAIAGQVTTLQSVVNTNNSTLAAAIQTEAMTRASIDGNLSAQYTVKVDVNGYVSGYGLASTANNSAPTSAFAVRADKFYIASPSGPGIAPAIPFIVQTTPTTINGVAVPVGVYMTEAFIANGTISNAKIGDLAVDTAKIADLAVGTAKIDALAVTNAKIAALAVTSAKINNASILNAHIGNAEITGAKIANATIINANIQNGAITNAKIGVAEVDYLRLAGGAATVSNSGTFASLNANNGFIILSLGVVPPADCYLNFGGYCEFTPLNGFYSASNKCRAICDIRIEITKNGTQIYNKIFKDSVVNGPWVGFNQAHGTAVGSFKNSFFGGIQSTASPGDVFYLNLYANAGFFDVTNSTYTPGGSVDSGECIFMASFR